MIVGLDLGTSSLKVVVIDGDGSLVASSERGYEVETPERGWAETDPMAWWAAATGAVRDLPEDVRSAVSAVGLSGQMHSVVLSTASGTAVRPAILWSDTRSKDVLGVFRALGREQRRRLANPIVTGMTGPTLLWLARHEPDALASARWALQPKDWLRLRLTGIAAADPSDASATLLYDIPADGWAHDIARDLGISPDLLAPIEPSHAVAGPLLETAAVALGLPTGVPVVIGAGDTPAAAYGSGLVHPNDGQLSVGTGAQIVLIGGRADVPLQPRTHLYRSALPGQHYVMAAMQNAGLALQWVRTLLGMTWQELYGCFDPASIPQELAFLPYLTGERTPLMDAGARAAWVGLGLHHRREDLAAAALVGVGLSILDGLEALKASGASIGRMRLTGGGARDPRFAQFLCDLLQVPLEPADTPRASAMGAARLALAATTGVDPWSLAAPWSRGPHGGFVPETDAARVFEVAKSYFDAREKLYPGVEGER